MTWQECAAAIARGGVKGLRLDASAVSALLHAFDKEMQAISLSGSKVLERLTAQAPPALEVHDLLELEDAARRAMSEVDPIEVADIGALSDRALGMPDTSSRQQHLIALGARFIRALAVSRAVREILGVKNVAVARGSERGCDPGLPVTTPNTGSFSATNSLLRPREVTDSFAVTTTVPAAATDSEAGRSGGAPMHAAATVGVWGTNARATSAETDAGRFTEEPEEPAGSTAAQKALAEYASVQEQLTDGEYVSVHEQFADGATQVPVTAETEESSLRRHRSRFAGKRRKRRERTHEIGSAPSEVQSLVLENEDNTGRPTRLDLLVRFLWAPILSAIWASLIVEHADPATESYLRSQCFIQAGLLSLTAGIAVLAAYGLPHEASRLKWIIAISCVGANLSTVVASGAGSYAAFGNLDLLRAEGVWGSLFNSVPLVILAYLQILRAPLYARVGCALGCATFWAVAIMGSPDSSALQQARLHLATPPSLLLTAVGLDLMLRARTPAVVRTKAKPTAGRGDLDAMQRTGLRDRTRARLERRQTRNPLLRLPSRFESLQAAFLLMLFLGAGYHLYSVRFPSDDDTVRASAPQASATRPSALPRGVRHGARPSEYVNEKDGTVLVWIPPGTFRMGSESGSADEQPVHEVRFAQGFFMAKYETTWGQFRAFCRATGRSEPHRQSGADDSHPANVDWNDAVAYCEWAGLRLPSEAEWEYACRAGSEGSYCFGNSDRQLGQYAWYSANATGTNPVGQKQANAWGLHDVHGNAWEWVQDTYQDSYSGAPSDGRAWEVTGSSHRVLRGNGWFDGAFFCRASYRNKSDPGNRSSTGFRPAR